MYESMTKPGTAGAAKDDRAEQAPIEPATLASSLDQSGIGLWSFDTRADEIRWSPSLCRIFGLEVDQAPRRYADWRRYLHPDDVERVESTVNASLVHGRYPDLEHRIVRPTGEVRHILAKARVETDEHGGVARLIGATLDVTELRSEGQRAAEAARLESVSRLAGGVAHDFNNMLTIILGSVNLALELSSRSDPRYESLLEIRTAAEGSAALTARLLAFARRIPGEPRPLDLGALVTAAERFVKRLAGAGVVVRVELGPTPPVNADPAQIEQVLMNLSSNALEAMGGQGTLTFRTLPVRRPEGTFARLEVIDSGQGIDPSHLPHVFEPFFSTQGPYRSPGLGLSMVHGLVRQHGGHVDVASTPGVGTRFGVELPGHVADRAAPASTAPPERPSAPRPARILLAESEPSQRAVMALGLRRLGHEVIEAGDGLDALAFAAAHMPDLLVCEARMPRLDGLELVRTLRADHPALPVVMMSGWTDADRVARPFPPDIGEVAWIPRPCPVEVLALKAEQALGRA